MTNYNTRETLDLSNSRIRRSKFAGIFRQVFQAIRKNMERYEAISEHQAMDNRVLRDLGIYRGDIPRVVDGLFDNGRLRRQVAVAVVEPARREKAPTSVVYPA